MKQFLFVIGVASAAGCVTGAEEVGGAEQALGNGYIVSRVEQERLGLVTVNGASGVMLDNRLGLSAGHVVGRNPASVGFVWDTAYPASQTYTFSKADLSVFRLDEPLEMNGSKTGFENLLGQPEVGDLVDTYGQGDRVVLHDSDHVMRGGTMQVTQIGTPDPVYTEMIQAPSQILNGDSGGPSFDHDVVVGIHGMSETAPNCTNCLSWDITVWPRFWGIVAASTPWGTETTNLLNIMALEIEANREIAYDVATGPWYELARIANTMCTNRSDQSAGHFTGFTGSDRYELACTGKQNKRVKVLKSTPGQRMDVGLTAPYENLGWAEANRFAWNDCRGREITTAGFYTGDWDAGDTWTLNCYRGTVFDAQRVELVSYGFPGKDLADTRYDEAMRAAHKFCAGRTNNETTPPSVYKTGFMTGFEVIGKSYEILCEY